MHKLVMRSSHYYRTMIQWESLSCMHNEFEANSIHTQPILLFSSTPAHWKCTCILVQDDPKLLDNDGEISKSLGRGWRFNSRLRNLLSTWQKQLLGGQLAHVLWRWHVGLLSQKKKKLKCTWIEHPTRWNVHVHNNNISQNDGWNLNG